MVLSNEGSNSVSVLLNVGGALMTSTSSPNPSNVGQPVTFTATVNPSVNVTGRAAPTGTVSFFSNGSLLGTGTLTNGTATFGTSFATQGSYTITTSYSGDSNYNPNSAPSFIQVVNPGTGTVTLTPTSLTFKTQVINTTSPGQNVTLTNTGTVAVTINSISTAAPFSQTNNCPGTLQPSQNCTITVAFTPTKIATSTGTLSVADNASGSPQTVSLTGVGTQVSFSPTILNFGSLKVGQTSSPMTTTLTNVGSGTLTIRNVIIGGTNPGDFTLTSNTCGSTVGAGKSCAFTFTFTPSAKGIRSAQLQVGDNGGGSPQIVRLGGNGT